jgi:nicotinate-nucleotide adenylyltransferase
MSAKVGILGGTFDPIHVGHLDIGEAAERALGLTEVLFMPSHVPPHRSETFASSFHRFAMVTLTTLERPAWRASDLELRREGPSYTSATLRFLHDQGHPPTDLYFIVGADAFADVTMWKDYPEIFDLAHFAVVSRTGSPVADLQARLPELANRMTMAGGSGLSGDRLSIFLIDAPTTDVSSTAIRQRRARGESIAGLVVPAVQQHIERHMLYTRASEGTHARDFSTDPAAGRLHG